MPAKAISGRAGRTYAEPNFAQNAIQTLTSSDNRPIVTAVGMFAIGVAFLHSSWVEMILPA